MAPGSKSSASILRAPFRCRRLPCETYLCNVALGIDAISSGRSSNLSKVSKDGGKVSADLLFGQLEAALAALHHIEPGKRTAFQARLKNFHRLGYPPELETTKGKAALYPPGLAIKMAIALEMTELGLPPERIVSILANGAFAVGVAMKNAAAVLLGLSRGGILRPAQVSASSVAYLSFDPAALWPLTVDAHASVNEADTNLTLLCLRGTAIQREFLPLTNFSTRLSIINVTGLLSRLATPPDGIRGASRPDWWPHFLHAVGDHASAMLQDCEKAEEAAVEAYLNILDLRSAGVVGLSQARQFAEDMFLTANAVRPVMQRRADT